MRKIKFQEYFKLCNWWIWLQKNFDGYHVEQFVSSEEIKFWKVLRRCLWNIAASENNISLQNEKNSCCSSKRKLLTENDDFSYFQLFSTSPTPPPQMWDKLHCKKNMNRLPGGRFFAQWPFFLPSGRFFFGSGPQVPYFAQWPFFLAQVPFFAQVPFNSSCSLRKVCGGIKSFHKSAQPLKDIIQSFNNLPGSQYIWHSLNNIPLWLNCQSTRETL